MTGRAAPLGHAGAAVFLAALLTLGAPTPASAVSAESARFYEDALVRYEKDDVAGAVIQLKNALQKDAGNLAAHMLLGKASLRTGDFPAAEAAFEQALKLGVDRSEVLLLYAQALSAQGKYDVLLERVTTGGLPRQVQVDVLVARGNAQIAKGAGTAAMRTFDDALALDPKSATVRLAQARQLMRMGEINRAGALIEEALKLSPKAATGWNLRASVAHLKGDLPAALAGYAKAIEFDPNDLDARVAQAGLLLDLGRQDDAEKALAELQRIAPREPRASYLRAVIAGRKGEFESAKKSLAEVVALIDPAPKNVVGQHPQLMLVAGLSHYGLANKEKAKEYLELFVAHNPGHPGASKVLSSIYIDAGNTTRAVRLLEPLQKSAPNDPDVLSLLAAAYMADRRYALAATTLEQAVKLSGGSAATRASFGVSLVGLGQADLGMAQLEQAFAKDPGQARAGVALATLYMKRNQPKKAADAIDAVVRRNPKNVAALNLQGVVHVAAGDRAGGRAAYEQALALDSRYHGARLNLARLDVAEGKPDVARARLDELLKVSPRNGDAMYEMALLEESAGNAAEAMRWLEKAMTNPRQSTRAGVHLTNLLLRQRNVERALAVSKQVVTNAPKDLTALFARSRAQIAAGEFGGARLTLKDASVVAGFDPRANLELAQLQLAAKDRDGAVYSVDRVLKANPAFLPAQVMMGEMEIASGEHAKAEQRARQLTERFPAQGAGPRLLGDAAVARGQYSVALNHYRVALAKDRNAEAALRVYRAHVLAGETPRALAFLEQWQKENRGDASVDRALADGYLRAGNLVAARGGYEKVLARRPDDVDVLNNLAQVALRQRDNAAALDFAEKAFRLAPVDAAVIDTLGWVLVQQGQLDRGIGVLRDARLRDPANPEIRYHLAAALAQSGREAEARTELAAILKDGARFEGADAARTLQRQLGR